MLKSCADDRYARAAYTWSIFDFNKANKSQLGSVNQPMSRPDFVMKTFSMKISFISLWSRRAAVLH